MVDMTVGDQRPLPLGQFRVSTVPLLAGVLVLILLVFSKGPNAAAFQGVEEPATTQTTAVEGETENPSTPVPGDEPSSDRSNTGLILLTAGVVTAVIAVIAVIAARRDTSASPTPPAGSVRHWPIRAESVLQEGRELVDLTVADHPREGASGLTVSQLGLLASRLELFGAHLSDLKMTASSEDARRALSLAAAHTSQLRGVAAAERRLRLSSPAPDEAMLAGLAMQLATERTALDDALHKLSRSKEGSL